MKEKNNSNIEILGMVIALGVFGFNIITHTNHMQNPPTGFIHVVERVEAKGEKSEPAYREYIKLRRKNQVQNEIIIGENSRTSKLAEAETIPTISGLSVTH